MSILKENVFVRNFAVYVESMGSSKNEREIGFVDTCLTPQLKFDFWPQVARANFNIKAGIYSLQFISYGPNRGNQVAAVIVSGSLAAIRNFDFYLKRIARTHAANLSKGGKNIGSELSYSKTSRSQDLPKQREELQSSYESQNSGEGNQPPIDRRFFDIFVGYFGGFALAVFGGIVFDGGKYDWFGRCLIGLSCLGAVFGVVLWFLTGFPATWNWMV